MLTRDNNQAYFMRIIWHKFELDAAFTAKYRSVDFAGIHTFCGAVASQLSSSFSQGVC